MKLTTPVHVPESSIRIGYGDSIMFVGSCFAEEVGAWFTRHRFRSCVNPFGIIFNPVSLSANLDRMIEGRLFSPDELVEHGEMWHSMDHHGAFSSASIDVALDKMNSELMHGREFLLNAKWLILTFGTAWVYERQGRVVANCHKLSSTEFERKLMSHSAIAGMWMKTSARLRSFNPDLNVIFSVSPVRYLKHGAVENQLSKSHLLIAVNQLREQGAGSYFPAYEIMMDELRDYRFWDRDMAHPSDTAVDFILDKFRSAWLSPESAALSDKLDPWLSLLEHRPIHETQEQTARRIEKAEMEIQQIMSEVK
ncbi:MAG: hypothetical protein RL220_1155 [Bacteroidota bacterium]